MKTTGTATWRRSFKEGNGAVSTKSGIVTDFPFGYGSRFLGKAGTNPEELIGAALAGSFTMALSSILSEENLTATKLETAAEISLEKIKEEYVITAVDVQLQAEVPGVTKARFQEMAKQALKACPVSRILNAKITLNADLAE